jgi:hypothetical protein
MNEVTQYIENNLLINKFLYALTTGFYRNKYYKAFRNEEYPV